MDNDKATAREELYQAVRRTWLKQEPYERGIFRAVRAYALAVHIEACTAATGFPDLDKVRSCGLGGWYCRVAQPYLPAK